MPQVWAIGSPTAFRGSTSFSPSSAGPQKAPSTTVNLPAAERLGDRLDVGHLEDPEGGGELVGAVARQLVPGAQQLERALPGEEGHPGVGLLAFEEVELERGDHAVGAAAAPQRPEELGVVLGVDPALGSVGGDELDRGEGVRLQAAAARVPADAAHQRVAGDADGAAGSVEGREAVRRDGLDDGAPLDAGADAGALRAGVDLDLVERARLHAAAFPRRPAGRPRCGPWTAARCRAPRPRRSGRPRRRRSHRPGAAPRRGAGRRRG